MATTSSGIFPLPDLGEGLQEAEIVAWHVNEGDHVAAEQPLVSVETDKAVVEIPCPHAGRIARLLAKPGTRLEIGAPLVEFAEGAEQDTGTVVGELADPLSSPPAPLKSPPEPRAATRPRIVPAVRALAASLGVDLASVTPSGSAGEITRADVERAAARPPESTAGEGAFEPLGGVRRAMAVRMAEAGAAVVPATVTEEANIQAWSVETDVTARLVAAVAQACGAEPTLNATFDGRHLSRRLNAAVHLGIAMDSPDGLFVPVLRNAERLDPMSVRREVNRFKKAVETRTIEPAELRGATITLSNFGTMAGIFASLVVVPPQVAILGVGHVISPLAQGQAVAAAPRRLPLSLTFDHRAVTGGEAARFLSAVKTALENPS